MAKMRAHRQAGFTLTEVMVVLVIIGILSAVAMPLMGRDRIARDGRDFAAEVARALQMAKHQAVADRLSIRAFVYRNRVELRSAVAGATPGAAPRAPTAADPILRALHAKAGLSVVAVLPVGAALPSTQVLDGAVAAEIEFNSLGQARLVGGAQFAGTVIYIRNDALRAAHIDRQFRVDVSGLTGFVRLRPRWN